MNIKITGFGDDHATLQLPDGNLLVVNFSLVGEDTRTEIERLRAELTEAAAFLDTLAVRLEGLVDPDWHGVADTAAECRAMANKLRGEA